MPPTPTEKPDEDANEVLRALMVEFQHRVEETAFEIKAAKKQTFLSAEHIRTAYRRLTTSAGGRTDAQKLITAAFKENRFVEWTGYGMALV